MNKSYILDYVDNASTNDDIKKFGVYRIYHKSKPKIEYIGSTSVNYRNKPSSIGFWCRFGTHLSLLRNGKHHSKFLQRVVNKYGINGVRFEIIEICNPEDSLKREQYYIDLRSPEYNSVKKVVHSSGYKMTNEQKDKIRQAKKKPMSLQARKRLSQSLKGRINDMSHLRTPEVRALVSMKLRGRKKPQSLIDKVSKKINQFTLSGIFVSSYVSMAEASRVTGINRSSINANALNIRPSAGGFVWSFDDQSKGLINNNEVVCLTLDNVPVRKYKNPTEAASAMKTSSSTSIRACLNNKQHKAYGYKWKWARERGFKIDHL